MRRRDNGCPIPPAAPRTVTLESYIEYRISWDSPNDGAKPISSVERSDREDYLTSLAEAEKALVWTAPVNALRAANMM